MSIEEYSAPESEKEFITCGTYLNCYCPQCNINFNQGESAFFNFVSPNGKFGELKLSPYLCVHTRESTLSIPQGKEIKDMICPHCKKSLIVSDEKCKICGSSVARILIAALTKIVPLYICMKVGCHYHGLSVEDEKIIQLDNSTEW